MAASGRILFSSYPYNGQGAQNTGIMGRAENLPSALTRYYGAPAGTTAGNGIAIASIVELLPTGLQVQSTKYYTPSTVAQIDSASS